MARQMNTMSARVATGAVAAFVPYTADYFFFRN